MRFGLSGVGVEDFAVIVRGNTAHIVVHGRQHRDRLAGQVDTGKNLGRFGDTRQALVQHFWIKVIEVQVDVVLVRANAATFADFERHAARDDVARGEVFRVRSIALHEALALGIGEISALATRALGDENAGAINARGVELHEFHILQRQAGAGHHAIAVAGAGMGRGGGKVGAAIAAGRQHNHLGAEAVQRAVVELPGDDALALAVFAHDQVEGKVLDEELRVVLDRLAIERVEDRVAGTVGRGAGALHRRAIAEFGHMTAERALINLAILSAAEGNAVVLKFVDGGRRFTRQIFHGVVVAQPVRTFDGVIHVPLPRVRAHVLERSGNAALGCHGMRAGGKNLGDAGGIKTLLGHAERGAQTRAASANHHHVEFVVDQFVIGHFDQPQKTILSTAPAPARPTIRQKSVLSSMVRRYMEPAK